MMMMKMMMMMMMKKMMMKTCRSEDGAFQDAAMLVHSFQMKNRKGLASNIM